ncbi:MAG: molybdopterin oxidoreductase family protein, partial [Dehalococcoidia bacterium]
LDLTAQRLAEVRQKQGPQAIGFLGSPLTTNEENYLLQKLARAVVGSNNVDTSVGPVTRAVAGALRNAFGSELLPADMTQLARSKTIVAVADDLESSHNVACLRIKDAVVRDGARLIVVSARWGELCDFAQVWLRPPPGQEAATVAALTGTLLADPEVRRRRQEEQVEGLAEMGSEPPGLADGPKEMLPYAVQLLSEAVKDEALTPLSIIYAVPHFGAEAAGATTAAVANLAIACCGADAPRSLFLLPQEANVWGLRDAGATPELLPGYRPLQEEAARRQVEQAWGLPLPDSPGLGFAEMMEAADQGRLRALLVMGDNPLMLAPDQGGLRQALAKLEFLAVIDSLASDTANMAHVVLPDAGIYGKEGTITNADRRVLRLHAATAPQGEAQPAWRTLGALAARLAQRLDTAEVHTGYAGPAEIMDEMATLVPPYRQCRYGEMASGSQQPLNGLGPNRAALQAVPLAAAAKGKGFLLATGRSLYTSYDGAALHTPEADKLHREEFVEVNPTDAAALGVADGDEVVLRNQRGEVSIR